MFLNLIFRRLRLRENTFIFAFLYGGIYSILFFAIFSVSKLLMKKSLSVQDAIVSLIIWPLMFIVYMIKVQMFRLRLKQ